jgi:hypothetical protein
MVKVVECLPLFPCPLFQEGKGLGTDTDRNASFNNVWDIRNYKSDTDEELEAAS